MNGSFEQHTTLNCCGGFAALNWNQFASPDYYNAGCGNQDAGTPVNYFGTCSPLNGNGYVAIGLLNLPYETKEYIYQYLVTPLITNKTYYISFFFAKSDRTRLSVKKLGVYFSLSMPTASGNSFIKATPQVENHSGFLTDTINWNKIEGYFKALGGEQYLTIGNFNSNANTDTLFTGTSNPFFADAGSAYYAIDSVSLYDSLDYALITNIKKNESDFNVNIFPNPAQDKIQVLVNSKNKTDLTIKITDVLGREIKALEYEDEIDITDLEKGIYFLSLYQNSQLMVTKKVVKE